MGSKRTRPYHAGAAGVASIAEAEILFSDASQDVCLVPAGSVVMRTWAEVLVAFNAGTTNVLKVGVSGTTNKYMDTADIDETSVAASATKGPFKAETADVTVAAYYTQTGTAATTGKARVFVEFARLTANA